MTLIYILLGTIAYILWRIYRQREDDREQVADEKLDTEWEAKKREEFKEYPNLLGKIDYTWLDLFGKLYVDKGIPHLKAAFLIYLKESNSSEIDMEVDHRLVGPLWDLTAELFEHLDKYHEFEKDELEITIVTYWQNVAEKCKDLAGMDFEAAKKMFQLSPFIDMEKIPAWFPNKAGHPEKEIEFRDEDGFFPRKSEGSELMSKKLKELGL
jgi:hypothetical protein